MPEDSMLPSDEATKEVIDQATTTEPTFQEKLDGFLHSDLIYCVLILLP
jgi:hypothetical protein